MSLRRGILFLCFAIIFNLEFTSSSVSIIAPQIKYLDSDFTPVAIQDTSAPTTQQSITATITGNGNSYSITFSKLQNDPGHFGNWFYWDNSQTQIEFTPEITYTVSYGGQTRSIAVASPQTYEEIIKRLVAWFDKTQWGSPNGALNWAPNAGTFIASTIPGLSSNVFLDFIGRHLNPDGGDVRTYFWSAGIAGIGLSKAFDELDNTNFEILYPSYYNLLQDIINGYLSGYVDATIPYQNDIGKIASGMNQQNLINPATVEISSIPTLRFNGMIVSGLTKMAGALENVNPSVSNQLLAKAIAIYNYQGYGASNWPNPSSSSSNSLAQEYKISEIAGNIALASSGQGSSYLNTAAARIAEFKQLLRAYSNPTSNPSDIKGCLKRNWDINSECMHSRLGGAFNPALSEMYEYAVENDLTSTSWFVNDLQPIVLEAWNSAKRFQPFANTPYAMSNVFGSYPQVVYINGVGTLTGNAIKSVPGSNDKIAYLGVHGGSITPQLMMERTSNHFELDMAYFLIEMSKYFPNEEDAMKKAGKLAWYRVNGFNILGKSTIDGDKTGISVNNGNGQIAHYGNIWPSIPGTLAAQNGLIGDLNLGINDCGGWVCGEWHLQETQLALGVATSLYKDMIANIPSVNCQIESLSWLEQGPFASGKIATLQGTTTDCENGQAIDIQINEDDNGVLQQTSFGILTTTVQNNQFTKKIHAVHEQLDPASNPAVEYRAAANVQGSSQQTLSSNIITINPSQYSFAITNPIIIGNNVQLTVSTTAGGNYQAYIFVSLEQPVNDPEISISSSGGSLPLYWPDSGSYSQLASGQFSSSQPYTYTFTMPNINYETGYFGLVVGSNNIYTAPFRVKSVPINAGGSGITGGVISERYSGLFKGIGLIFGFTLIILAFVLVLKRSLKK